MLDGHRDTGRQLLGKILSSRYVHRIELWSYGSEAVVSSSRM